MRRGYKYSKEEFLVIVAKKKPSIQAILDNLESYTVDQIKTMTDQPLWVREALVSMRNKLAGMDDEKEALERASEIADQMVKASPNKSLYYDEDYEFFVRTWTGEDRFIGSAGKAGMEIQISHGDPIMLMTEFGKIRIGDTVVDLPASQWPVLIQNSQPLGKYTRLAYHEMHQAYLRKKHLLVQHGLPDQ